MPWPVLLTGAKDAKSFGQECRRQYQLGVDRVEAGRRAIAAQRARQEHRGAAAGKGAS